MKDPWEEVCDYIGYADAEELLNDMYVEQQLGLEAISRRIGLGIMTIRRQMDRLGIEMRSAGGPQAQQKKLYYLHLMDQRYVFGVGPSIVASRIGVNPAYVWRYHKRVKGEDIDALRADSSDEGPGPVLNRT